MNYGKNHEEGGVDNYDARKQTLHSTAQHSPAQHSPAQDVSAQILMRRIV